MRKIVIFLTILFLYGCEIWSEKGSRMWERNAPANEVEQFYNSQSVVDLCELWDDAEISTYTHLRRMRRNGIANELQDRGYDPMYCDKSKR